MIQTCLREEVDRKVSAGWEGWNRPPAQVEEGRFFTRTSLRYHHASNNLAHAPSVLASGPNGEKNPQVSGPGMASQVNAWALC